MLRIGLMLIFLATISCEEECSLKEELDKCLEQFQKTMMEAAEMDMWKMCRKMDAALGSLKDCQKTSTEETDVDLICQQLIEQHLSTADNVTVICHPDDECSIYGMMRCFEDFFKGAGVDTIRTVDDLEKIRNLVLNTTNAEIDRDLFCSNMEKLNWDEMNKCAMGKEKCRPMDVDDEESAAEPGAEPEGEDKKPEGTSTAEDSSDVIVQSDLGSVLANFSFVCEAGCEDILRVAESVAQFSINATTVKDVMNAKNGTEEFDKACKELNATVQEGADLAQQCRPLQFLIRDKVEEDAADALEDCGLTLTFPSAGAAQTAAISFHLLLCALLVVSIWRK